MKSNRRTFLKQSAVLSSAMAIPSLLSARTELDSQLSYHVFSKHLQFLDYKEAAARAADIGFDGVEWTVRPKGHVLPERVVDDLPKAIEATKASGLSYDLMVTNVTDSDKELDRQVLHTASEQGVKLYRLGYVPFSKEHSIPDRLRDLNWQMKKLADLNKALNLTGTYQNHAGKKVGAAIWDIWHLLDSISPDVLGCQYDIRHATVEGGNSWQTGLNLIRPKINCLVLKDFLWKKINGKWKIHNVPLGEGMVDFEAYFKLLKTYKINVPVSIHYEYDLAGAEHGDRDLAKADQEKVYVAMKKDLVFAKSLWQKVMSDE